MAKYRLAVFDLDGTLLDTSGGVLSAVRYTIEKCGLSPLDKETLESFIGPPVQDSFARAYGIEGQRLQELADVFRARYSSDASLFIAEPYEHIYDLLGELRARGVITAVATYKREDYARRLLERFEFDKYMDFIFGGDNFNKLKKRDIIEKCISAAGVADRGEVVMIGDTHLDALGAEAIGVDFIGVTYGFGFESASDVGKYSSVGSADTAMEILGFFD